MDNPLTSFLDGDSDSGRSAVSIPESLLAFEFFGKYAQCTLPPHISPRPYTTIHLDALPYQLKLRIVTFLPYEDLLSLATVNYLWQQVTEARLWRSISLEAKSRIVPGDKPRSISQRWSALYDHMCNIPRRRNAILNFRGPQGADMFMDAFRCLLAMHDNLESLTETGKPESTSGGMISSFIAHRRPSKLKFLSINLSKAWESDILPIFPKTPDLRELIIKVDNVNLRPNAKLEMEEGCVLEHLKTIKIQSDRWMDAVLLLLAAAQGVDTLMIKSESSEFDRDLARIDEVLNGREFKHLAFTARKVGIRIQHLSYTSIKMIGWMPSLETMILDIELGPGGLPAHTNLRHLGIIRHDERYPTHFIGSRPSNLVTGRIAPWLADALSALPRLTTLRLIAMSELSVDDQIESTDPYCNIKVYSYTNGTDTLYHCHYNHDTKIKRYVGSHELSYGHEQMEWTEDDNGADNDVKGKLGPMDKAKKLQAHDVVSMTFYKGYPLPKALLALVIHANEPADDNGGRGLTLPDDVWTALNGWIDAVRRSAPAPAPVVIPSLSSMATIQSDKFNPEIRKLILSYADLDTKKALSQVNKHWLDVTEPILWGCINLTRTSFRDPNFLDLEDAKARNAELHQNWIRCFEDIQRKPIRKRLIRHIVCTSVKEAKAVITALLKAVAPTIEVIEQIDDRHPGHIEPGSEYVYASSEIRLNRLKGDDARPLISEIMVKIKSFPNLRDLDLQLNEEWIKLALAVINTAPDLEKLFVVSSDAKIYSQKKRTSKVRLHRLHTLKIYSPRWHHGCNEILRLAPKVHTLAISVGDPRSIPRCSPDMPDGDIMSNTVLKNLTIHGHKMNIPPYLERWTEINGARALPSAENLAVTGQWGPYLRYIPETTKHLGVFCTEFDGITHYTGSTPSNQVTGMLAPWLRLLVERSPRLVSLSAIHPDDFGTQSHPVWYDEEPTLRLATYAGDDGMGGKQWLYHVRVNVSSSTRHLFKKWSAVDRYRRRNRIFSPLNYQEELKTDEMRENMVSKVKETSAEKADIMMEEQETNIPKEDKGKGKEVKGKGKKTKKGKGKEKGKESRKVDKTEKGVENGIPDSSATRMITPPDGLREGYQIDEPNCPERPFGWVDLTSFRGFPLPKALWNWVYEQAQLENDDGIELGKREATLPSYVWTILDVWANEVEAENRRESERYDRLRAERDRMESKKGYTSNPRYKAILEKLKPFQATTEDIDDEYFYDSVPDMYMDEMEMDYMGEYSLSEYEYMMDMGMLSDEEEDDIWFLP